MENNQQFENLQYYVVKTQKKLIEAKKTTINKVQWFISDYSNGTGEKKKDISAYVDERIMVAFARRVLNGGVNLPQTPDSYGNTTLYFEQKIHGHKEDKTTGLCPVFSIKFIKNGPTMRIPYKIMIEEGVGALQKQENGGTSIKTGTYKKIGSLDVMLSQMDFEIFFSEILTHYEAKKAAEEMMKLVEEKKSQKG